MEQAGFVHNLLVDTDADSVATIQDNRPRWTVQQADVRDLSGNLHSADLIAAGMPAGAFSVASSRADAHANALATSTLRLVGEIRPRAVMLDNVRGLGERRFAPHRALITSELESMGYACDWRVLYASYFGVPQVRGRLFLVALRQDAFHRFDWPLTSQYPAPTVGDTLSADMKALGWAGAALWSQHADGLAPAIVGGSKAHGGADLGPTRARQAWLALGVDGRSIAAHAPTSDTPVGHIPRLTNHMVARLQGFPDAWRFTGSKTSIYRQIANALPPPMAAAVGTAIRDAIKVSALH